MSKVNLLQSLQELSLNEFASSKENARVAIVQKLRPSNLSKLFTNFTDSLEKETTPLWDILESECIAPQALVTFFKFALAQTLPIETKYAISKVSVLPEAFVVLILRLALSGAASLAGRGYLFAVRHVPLQGHSAARQEVVHRAGL